MQTQTLAISIERPWQEVYDVLAVPENFPKWASGLAATLQRVGEVWIAEAPEGLVTVRFSGRNALGVADHWVTLPSGEELYIPLRVIANGGGSEVLLTLFRRHGVDDAAFAADAAWVQRDLAALKRLMET